MKICLSNLSFRKIDFENFLLSVNNNNFEYIELAPSLVSKNPYKLKTANSIKSKIKLYKIKIVSLQSLFYKFKQNDSEKKILDHFKKIFNFCKQLNVKKITLGSAPFRKLNLNQKSLNEYNKKIFLKLSIMAKKYKVILCIEPISKIYSNRFLKNHNEVLSFIKNLNLNNIRMVFDYGNYYQKDHFSFIKKNIKYIEHIHIGKKNIFKLDLNKIKNSIFELNKIGYRKSVTFEYVNNNGKDLLEINKFLKKQKNN